MAEKELIETQLFKVKVASLNIAYPIFEIKF